MIKLSPRLMSAVGYVRPGHLLADVGTDHAYLPIYLCQAGILTPRPSADGNALCALACDINQGPVDRATVHVAAAGLSDRIRTVRTDGLSGLARYAPTDIVIFGMGGELIVSILQAAPWIMTPGIRLILQPMTHPEVLRGWLITHGFALMGETLSREGDRIYQTVCASYASGSVGADSSSGLSGADALSDLARSYASIGTTSLSERPYTPAELLVGRDYPGSQKTLYLTLIERALCTADVRREARCGAGLPTDAENDLICSLIALKKAVTPGSDTS